MRKTDVTRMCQSSWRNLQKRRREESRRRSKALVLVISYCNVVMLLWLTDTFTGGGNLSGDDTGKEGTPNSIKSKFTDVRLPTCN